MPSHGAPAAGRFGALLRSLDTSAGAAGISILVLSLGLGTLLGAFLLIDGILLRGLPYPAPRQLVALSWDSPQGRQDLSPIATMDDLAEESPSAAGFAGYRPLQGVTLGLLEEPEPYPAWQVSWNFLQLLGYHPERGDFFAREHEDFGTPAVVVSHGLWRNYFSGDPALVGKTVLLNGQPWTVIGVAPQGLELPGNAKVDVFLPLDRVRERVDYLTATHRWIARMKPGITRAQFQTELATILRKREATNPSLRARDHSLFVEDLQHSLLGQQNLLPLASLALAALLFLFLCNSTTSLLLEGHRSHPDKAPPILPALVAHLSMALAAAFLGLGLALLFLKAVPQALGGFDDLNGFQRLGISGRTLAAALLLGVLEGTFLALMARVGRRGVHQASSTFSWSPRLRLVVHASLAVLMLTLAGLFTKSFLRAIQVDPGLDPRGLYALKIELPETRYDEAAVQASRMALLVRLAGMPEIDSVSAATSDPLSRASDSIDCQEAGGDLPWRRVRINGVSDGYFEALRIGLLRGRGLHRGDVSGTVINESLARELFPGLNPIGRRLRLRSAFSPRFSAPAEVEILGVARDIRSEGPGSAVHPGLSLPFSAFPGRDFTVLMRSSRPVLELQRAVAAQCLLLDPYLNPGSLVSLEAAVAGNLAKLRLTFVLMGICALLALVLATLPLRSLLARAFSQRLQEMEMHPSWDPSFTSGLRRTLSQIALYSGLGALLGVVSALLVGRVLSRQLLGLSVFDPGIILLAFLLFGLTGGLLGLIPAFRAHRETSRRQAREAQWVQLKGQLNPHVFFNAMNNLTALIRKDPVQAERAAENLTSLFRRLMAHGHRPVAPLGDERALLETYLAVEALRFGPRLTVIWEWDSNLDAVMAPPFLVQPLAENAIKHGLSPAPEGGELRIKGHIADGWVTLRVENTGCPLVSRRQGGLGLENLEARLRLFFPRDAKFRLASEPSGTLAEVRFPLMQELP